MKKCALYRLLGRDSERGIALILTLAILVMVTLLVVAFAVSMRVENTASKNFNDLIKARQLAQAGIDDAVALIGNATPPAPPVGTTPTISWAAAPGVIYGLRKLLIDWSLHEFVEPPLGEVSPAHYAPYESIVVDPYERNFLI